MAKNKNRKDKEVSALRREVEVLRAQLKSQGGVSQSEKGPVTPIKNVARKEDDIKNEEALMAGYIRSSLKKTFFISLVTFSVTLGLFFTQRFWLPLLNLKP